MSLSQTRRRRRIQSVSPTPCVRQQCGQEKELSQVLVQMGGRRWARTVMPALVQLTRNRVKHSGERQVSLSPSVDPADHQYQDSHGERTVRFGPKEAGLPLLPASPTPSLRPPEPPAQSRRGSHALSYPFFVSDSGTRTSTSAMIAIAARLRRYVGFSKT
ncbi:MAG: hypothetical protein H6Q31_2824 [Bacteroidetes bacterium]|nr:hypothetical protein [Bacteroidota bacterium]